MRRSLAPTTLTAALALLVSLAAMAAPAQDQAPPANPAMGHLKAYIETFNAGVPGGMKSFFSTHLADQALKEIPIGPRLVRFQKAKAQLQSLDIVRVVTDEPALAAILAKAGSGGFLLIRATAEAAKPFKLIGLTLNFVDNPDNIVTPEPKSGEADLVVAVRDFLEAQTKADEFSGVVLVARDKRVIFHEAYGFADREQKIANRKDTKFNLGSINKIFTRAAVHQLARRGLLSLDDTIAKFLPDYPNADAATKVTVRHLLNMTSGIGDFFGDRFDATPKEKIRALRDYLPLFADKPLEFEPGTSNKYSNGGYIVLGLIIEKVSGVDYYAYVRENIFKPLGMTDTDAYPRDAGTPNLARGYTRPEAGGPRALNFDTLPGRGSSAGGGYSTALDMLQFVQAVQGQKIFLPDSPTGLGLAGGAPGINSVVEWDPRSGYRVIVLANFDPPAAGDAARRIMSWLPR